MNCNLQKQEINKGIHRGYIYQNGSIKTFFGTYWAGYAIYLCIIILQRCTGQ